MKTDVTPLPPLRGTNKTGHTKEEKTEILAESIELQCTPNNHLGDEDTENTANQNILYVNQQPSQPIKHTTLSELVNIINQLKTRKAPGLDGINNKAAKLMPKKSKVKLLNILNAWLRLNYFPEIWKTATIITFPKPGKDHQQPENHRPISLLSTFSKIYEKVLLVRLKEEIEIKQIIRPEQFGFRAAHSCELQTLRTTEIISQGLEAKSTTTMAYLDISKAFDKMWHEGLILKMCQIEFSIGLTKTIRSFLLDRKFKVKLEDHISTIKKVRAGVPQGSVLRPTLYNIYTYDIPETKDTFKALFADDTALGSQSKNTNMAIIRLQRSLNIVSDWMKDWKIAINEEKIQAICFDKKHRAPTRTLQVNGQQIPWKRTAKYLGMTFDPRLTWETHTNNIKKIGTIAMIRLYSMLKNDRLHPRTKMIIYTSVIRPAITYASTTWGCAANTHIKKVQTIQNKILRIIMSAPWFVSNKQLHRELGVPSIRRYTKQVAKQVITRAETHENNTLREAVNYNLQDCRVFTRRPRLIVELDDGPF